MKSMIGELTDSTNIAFAFSFIPSTWYLGATAGFVSSLFGSLPRVSNFYKTTHRWIIRTTCREVPWYIRRLDLLQGIPLLPSMHISCNYCSNMVVHRFFLYEGGLSFPVVQSNLADVALQTTKPQASPMEYFFGRRRKCNTTEHSSPTVENGALTHTRESPVPFCELFVTPVLVAAGSYASFALIDMAFRTVFPVYLSTPITIGGLGLDPSAIGTILAIVGTGNGVCQLFLFARLHNWLGAKNLFLAATSSYLPVIAFLPITNWVAQAHGLNGLVWLLLGIQMLLSVFTNFSFCKKLSTFLCLVPMTKYANFSGVIFIYINASAPNRASIGATNGIAQMLVSFMRAIAPAAVNSAFSLSIQKHVMGGYFVYWLMVGMVGITLTMVCSLPRKPGHF